MYTRLSFAVRIAAFVLAAAWLSPAEAQTPVRANFQDPQAAVSVRIPPEIPLTVVEQDLSDTEIYTRGAAIVIDLRCRLEIRNNGKKAIRGITFAAYAQQLTAGGRATVALPSLHLEPGQTMPASLNLRLLRPLPGPQSALVEISVDGVLMADGTFVGPDQLSSRRKMLAWEAEADRDRRYFLGALEAGGPEKLRREVTASLERQAARPRIEARATGSAASISAAAERQTVSLAALDFAASPLAIVGGSGGIAGDLVEAPRVEVRNRSERSIRYFEIGWLVEDAAGRRYSVGALPAKDGSGMVPPGGTTESAPGRAFQLSSSQGSASPVKAEKLSGFVRQVEFSDGSIWVAPREALNSGGLLDVVPVSAEEQRLTDLYRRHGLQALSDELSKLTR